MSYSGTLFVHKATCMIYLHILQSSKLIKHACLLLSDKALFVVNNMKRMIRRGKKILHPSVLRKEKHIKQIKMCLFGAFSRSFADVRT